MKRILRIGRGVKVRRARVKEVCDLPLNVVDVGMKAELIQALIPIGLWYVKEVLERGLKIEPGLLCVIDGSKGLRKAVYEVFGMKALIQRCQWHDLKDCSRRL